MFSRSFMAKLQVHVSLSLYTQGHVSHFHDKIKQVALLKFALEGSEPPMFLLVNALEGFGSSPRISTGLNRSPWVWTPCDFCWDRP